MGLLLVKWDLAFSVGFGEGLQKLVLKFLFKPDGRQVLSETMPIWEAVGFPEPCRQSTIPGSHQSMVAIQGIVEFDFRIPTHHSWVAARFSHRNPGEILIFNSLAKVACDKGVLVGTLNSEKSRCAALAKEI
jgi:hypothetical protein